MSIADRTVFFVTCACAAVALGIGLGEENTRRQLATVCEQQPGAVLVSTVQDRNGIQCNYAISYGRAVNVRKAKKS